LYATELVQYHKTKALVLILTDRLILSYFFFFFSALKPVFAESKQIANFSKEFVMINVEVSIRVTTCRPTTDITLIFYHLMFKDDEEPKDEQFNVDGKYFPRIFFLSKYKRDLIYG